MRSSTLLALAALGLVSLAARPAVAGTLLVPQQFSTIQAALTAAKPYDTVLVSAKPKGGVYNEAVTITTPNIVLQGVGNPIIDGAGLAVSVPNPYNPAYPTITYSNGIEIRASHVAVRGLTVQNTGDGTYYDSSSAINAGYLGANYTSFNNFSDIEISGVTLRNDTTGITITGQGTPAAPGGTVINPSGYRILGCLFTGEGKDGVDLNGVSNLVITGNQFTGNQGNGLSIGGGFSYPVTGALVAGNVFKNNAYDGADATGFGLLVTANESAANGDYGFFVNTAPFFGAAPGAAAASPSYVTLNSVHDNVLYGVDARGAQTIAANSITGNGGAGVYLDGADGSTISGNVITGTTLAGEYDGDGTGIFADFSAVSYGGDSGLKISANQVSGNSGDGIYFADTAGGVVSANSVTGNKGVGIHLSDYTYYNSYNGYAAVPTTVTQNRAVHNAVVDARDEASASDTITDSNGEYFSGDGAKTLNVWTKNLFGTTDPVGLSK